MLKNKYIKKVLPLIMIFVLLVVPAVTAQEDTFIVETKGSYNFDEAQNVLELVNEERAKVGLNSLKLDKELTELAMQRAAELSVYYNHLRPYYNTTVTAGGENIAVGYYSAQDVMDGWMSSPGHKRQIVPVEGYDSSACKSYKTIGIACYDCGDFNCWVQIFSVSEVKSEFNSRGTLDKDVEVEIMKSRLNGLDLKNQLLMFYDEDCTETFKLKANETLKLLKLKFRNLSKDWKYYSQITCKNVKFDTTDRNVCTVSNDGTITAVGPGNATITATLENIQDSINITVENPLKSISLPANIDITNKTPMKLNVTYVAENPKYDTTDDKTVTWKSDDKSIADVDDSGNVTGKKEGTTTITAKVGDFTAKCKVNVSVEIENITLSASNIPAYVNQTIKPLTVTYYPADSSNKGVSWSSDREDIASVDNDGTIHAKSKGKATITATTKNGKTAQCIVEVSEVHLTINKSIYQFSSLSEKLELKVSLSNGKDVPVTFKSENEKVLTVDANGNVTPLKGGLTNIIAISSEYGSVSCYIYVCVPVELEDGSKAYVGDLNRDGKFSMEDTNLILNIFMKGKASKYELDMADFDNNGVVDTADAAVLNSLIKYYDFKPGEYVPILNIKFVETKVKMIKGAESSVLPIITPVDTTDSTKLKWSSSKTNVAEVDQNGKVTAKSEGTTIITATLNDGKEASYTVVVEDYLKGDMNKDGKVNSLDASIVLDKFNYNDISDEDISIGDINGDKKLNAVDASLILDLYVKSN